jgi:hypothetical protein
MNRQHCMELLWKTHTLQQEYTSLVTNRLLYTVRIIAADSCQQGRKALSAQSLESSCIGHQNHNIILRVTNSVHLNRELGRIHNSVKCTLVTHHTPGFPCWCLTERTLVLIKPRDTSTGSLVPYSFPVIGVHAIE